MPGSRGALAAPPHALPGLPPRLLAPAHANRLRYSLIRALPPPQPRLPPRYHARAVALEASPNARTATPPHATPAACALAVALAVTPTTDSVADALAAAPRRHAHRLAALPPCCHARRCMCSSRSPPRRRARCLAAARAAALGRRRTAARAASRSSRPHPPCGRLLHRRFPHRQSLHRPLPPCGRFASAFGRGSAAVSVSPGGANPAAPSTSSFQQQLSHGRRRSVGVSELRPLITG